ncbi:Glycosyl transferases group 1 [Gracilibacillus orientalis]|uniref:Glycosyl transferases group 1 n=1 Tax=Gracilibacillus orientalis TaxID=334253 RepID=A0A1I4PIB7_9BACI|nr:glycosyltransferase [Gracilibacillus orientalis]SFM27296.1 Glycosyl transferases group 1 [Gracilibacillus orientalis]
MTRKDHNQMEVEQKLLEVEAMLEKEKDQYIQHRQEYRQVLATFNRIDQNRAIRSGFTWMKNAKAIATGKKTVKQTFDKKQMQKKAKQKIKKWKRSLYEYGFYETVIPELKQIVEKTNNPYDRKNAAMELAVWYANQYTVSAAEQALSYLDVLKKYTLSKEWSRRVTILEAESLLHLEEHDKAKQLLLDQIEMQEHPDLYLAMASTETISDKKVEWINQALALDQLKPITLEQSHQDRTLYDSIQVTDQLAQHDERPVVTVIIPVYNAEKTVQTALDSIINQTWSKLEVLVVDDCSTDNTVQVVEQYVQKDQRIKLLKNSENAGAYIARNRALQQATGEFVTVHDADDWSHPEKMEIQVKHLLENEHVIANTSQQARVTEDLQFHRRGKPGEYLFANMSSLMFRREIALERIGYWDSIRFGADGEFKKRLIKAFGKEAVVDVKTGPCAFQRQSSGSLTANSVFGYHGYFMGVRKEYLDAYTHYHQTHQDVYYPFPMTERPFAVPEPMWPVREAKSHDNRRHFDVIIVSEFRLLGGTNMSNIEEIKAQKELGLKTGLIQLYRHDLHSAQMINPKVREQIDGKHVQMIGYGEKVTCNVLIVRHPPVLQEWQKYVPDVEAKSIKVIVNQPPKRDYTKTEAALYNIRTCAKRLKHYFGKKAIWYPIGPSVREALEEHHQKHLAAITVAPEDWVNIINVAEWKRTERPARQGRIKIGRHSRAQYVKWPNDTEELLTIYPESKEFEIHVLGGAQVPEKLLGQIPQNWMVHEFGEIEPKDFLQEIDVFVYYTHPGWVEAFGRVIFEAMAAGVPVVISPSYKNLFKDAAIYAEPDQVQAKVKQLMEDAELYERQVAKALQFVEEQFGYSLHADRLEPHLLPTIAEVGDNHH